MGSSQVEQIGSTPVSLYICCDKNYGLCFEGQNFRRVNTLAVSVLWL